MGYNVNTRKRVLEFLRRHKQVIFTELLYLGMKSMQVKGTTLHEVLDDLKSEGLVRVKNKIRTRSGSSRVVLIEIEYVGG